MAQPRSRAARHRCTLSLECAGTMMRVGSLALLAFTLLGCAAATDVQGLLNQTQNVVDVLNPLQQVEKVQNQVDGLFQQQCGPIAPGQGFLPGGNIRTVDSSGPFNLSALSVQADEIQAGIAAKQGYTDRDIITFLTNVECLEGQFDTWGTFGRGFINGLEMGGPTPIGAQKANLSEATLRYLQEVALNEQGHVLFTRQAGALNPCPLVDFTGGFNGFFAAAYGVASVQAAFGAPFNPFLNDVNFVLSVLTLEEGGATGNKGLIGLTTNPVLANGIAGLATSATAQAAVERFLLYQMRNVIVQPFGETAQQVFARVSALREALTGTGLLDQGLVNTDPRFLAVSDGFVNNIPTDIRGLTRNRTPQQLINILTLGNPNGVGGFFPNGLIGNINKPTGYNATSSGLQDIPKNLVYSGQEPVAQVGTIMPPLTGPTPTSVPGEQYIIEPTSGPFQDPTYLTRGYTPLLTTYTVQGINTTTTG